MKQWNYFYPKDGRKLQLPTPIAQYPHTLTTIYKYHLLIAFSALGLLLAACTAQTPDPTPTAVAQVEPTSSPTAVPPSPTATAIPPTATPVAVPPTPTPIITVTPAPTLPPAGPYMAYVQENNLYIQDVAQSQPARLVDECEVERCLLLHLRWSPDGEYLLYFHGATTAAGDTSNEIRLVSKLGTWQTITNEAEAWRPAAWSPTGEQFAYLADTGQISEVEEGSSDQPLPLVELYTVEMGAEGELNEPELIGPLTLTQPGCGGGGRSASEELYELEAGTAYGYYSKVLAWTAQDILLFTLDCANTSIGRYDLATAAQLEPYAQTMRNLVLTADSSAWIAITGFPGDRNVTSYELVTGDPTETTIENIPTSRPVELVFSGRSGALYYTSRIRTDQVSLNEGAGPNFNFYETTLWQMDVDGANETALYVAADLALAHVQEAKDGALLFVRIENDRPLLEAVQSGVPQAQWPEYYPQRHIMLLRQDGAEPLQLVDNAGFVAVSQ